MDLAHIVAVAVLAVEAAVLLLALAAALAVSLLIAARVGSALPILGLLSGTAPAWLLRVVVDQLLILDDREPLGGAQRPPPNELGNARRKRVRLSA